MKEFSNEIRETLESIFTYTGTDLRHVRDAQVQTYMEWFLKRCNVKVELNEIHKTNNL